MRPENQGEQDSHQQSFLGKGNAVGYAGIFVIAHQLVSP